jgi:NAD(P)-dependent dehydrogenase (short-subunit alcohol dehydrogenase family)
VTSRGASNSLADDVENAFGEPQCVIVFAGSSDIARALTRRLCAARTRTVILAGRDEQRLDDARSEAYAHGARHVDVVLFDARDVASAERTVNEAFEKAGGTVDLVVVALGLLGDQSRNENDATLVAELVTVNFTWPVAALARVRARLVRQGSGPNCGHLVGRRCARAARQVLVRRSKGRPRSSVPGTRRFFGGDRRLATTCPAGTRALEDDDRRQRSSVCHRC